ncbi:unnamed protein product, partial [Mesorhabditis belari]|uniref:NAD-dependent epimerase/dehydratase domain-containing protein n=1 Tax=Mesorhabditis belari TaxID=2138241 RepID=A0AAF3EU45_9BILA
MDDGKLVLVSGASGYVASHCIKLLLEKGYRVRGTVRSLKNAEKVNPIRKLDPSGAQLELVEADLMQDETWPRAVKDCTYVLHVASPIGQGASQAFIDAAVRGATSVLRACGNEPSVKKVVQTSSTMAICDGNNPPKSKYDETDWTPIELQNSGWYTQSKVLAERAAWELWKSGELKNKFDFTVINPGFIVGPPLTDSTGSSMTLAIHIMTKPVIPVLNPNSIDVRDVAEAHIRAMERPETNGHRIIVADGAPITLKEYGLQLKKVFGPLGYCPATTVLPQFVIWIASFFVGDAGQLMKMQFDKRVDNTKMQELLGMNSWRNPLDGMVDMVDELIERGLIKKTEKWEQTRRRNK